MDQLWVAIGSAWGQLWVSLGSDMTQAIFHWFLYRFGAPRRFFISFCNVLEHPGDFTLVFVTFWSFGSALDQLRVTFGSGMAEVDFSLRFPTSRGLEVIFHWFL